MSYFTTIWFYFYSASQCCAVY